MQYRGEGDHQKRSMARANRRARAQRAICEAVLSGTWGYTVFLLWLAQTAAEKGAPGTVRVGGSRSGVPGGPAGGGPGVGIDQRRATAHRRRSGRRHIPHGAGSIAGMIHLPASVRVYVCLTACDMRRSFDGLHALVREYLELDAYAGHLFVFASRRRDRVKILYWDRDGFAVWSKRLEEGTYALPLAESAAEHR